MMKVMKVTIINWVDSLSGQAPLRYGGSTTMSLMLPINDRGPLSCSLHIGHRTLRLDEQFHD
jgi:hypothetical protein